MIIGIGCDLVDHNITESLKWESAPEQLQRIFSAEELNLYHTKRNIKFLAGRFAAKEAVVKCLNSGMEDGISLNHIQILQGKKGNPEIELFGQIKQISDELGIDIWHVSITHSATCSMAYVIAERNNFRAVSKD